MASFTSSTSFSLSSPPAASLRRSLSLSVSVRGCVRLLPPFLADPFFDLPGMQPKGKYPKLPPFIPACLPACFSLFFQKQPTEESNGDVTEEQKKKGKTIKMKDKSTKTKRRCEEEIPSFRKAAPPHTRGKKKERKPDQRERNFGH
mmetsp:Transcript_31875/g.63117  ORF Transcript_31875/g.63117 Transcript_31875/m.63117 type:complete len:146 (-) Transcript_31875:757-1194(-)